MSYSINKINKVLSLFKLDNCVNPYVSYIKECYIKGYKSLSDFDIRYVLENFNFSPIYIKRTIKITDWYGAKLAENLKIDFIPQKLYIISVIGAIGSSLHCYVRYRQSVKEPILIFIPKKALFEDIFLKNYKEKDIDFSLYNKITEKIGRSLKPHQEDAVKFLTTRNKAILADEQGLGKEIDINTILPTPDGYKYAKDIHVGDKLFGSDGKPHNVIGVFYQGIKDIYEITFTDGAKCNCGIDHLWITRKSYENENSTWSVKSLKEILKDDEWRLKYEIPICSPVEYDKKFNDDTLFEFGKRVFSYENNENIDKKILLSSLNNRISLLKGAVLNSYSVSENNITLKFKNEDKSNILTEIIYSLGGFVNKQKIDGDIFVTIYLNFNIFSEKLEKKDIIKRYFYKIEKKYKSEAVCFKVDSIDSSFLTENYIVTHNTTSTIVASMAGGYNKILIICPASLKGTWKRELSYYINENDIAIINSKKWISGKKYTIINYDILQNFYHVPTEIDYEIVEEIDKNGKKINRRVPKKVKSKTKKGEYEFKMKKSRKKDVIFDCMSKSELYNEHFDLIIIDEVQKLANNNSIRYIVLDDFIKRSNPRGIYCVTGTPLTNRPLNLYHILKLINADVVQDYEYYMNRFCDSKKIEKKDGTVIRKNDGASNLDELRDKIKGLYIRRLQKDIPGMVKKTINTRFYTLSDEEMIEYNKLWNEYLESQSKLNTEEAEKYRDLIEGGLVRRFLADKMIKNTIELTNEHLDDDEKVMIVCCFDNEVKKFKEYYGDKAVVYDGKKTNKQKDKAEYEFMNNPNKKVFIGQILASGVGITLTKSHICIFNSYSWVPSDNWQVMDRVHRLSQTEDVTVYYQLFDDDISINMWNKIMSKENIIKSVIKSEGEK